MGAESYNIPLVDENLGITTEQQQERKERKEKKNK